MTSKTIYTKNFFVVKEEKLSKTGKPLYSIQTHEGGAFVAQFKYKKNAINAAKALCAEKE